MSDQDLRELARTNDPDPEAQVERIARLYRAGLIHKSQIELAQWCKHWLAFEVAQSVGICWANNPARTAGWRYTVSMNSSWLSKTTMIAYDSLAASPQADHLSYKDWWARARPAMLELMQECIRADFDRLVASL